MRVDLLKANTPSWVFEQWKLAYDLEPWGDDWLQTGVVAHAACQPHLKKQMRIEDFMPGKRKVGMTDAAQVERALAAMCGVAI